MDSVGIAVASGTLKGVFAHGVLSGLEDAGVRAAVYGGVSSSTLSTGLAAGASARAVGVQYWLEALEWAQEFDGDMSRVVLRTLEVYGPTIIDSVFGTSDAPSVGLLTCHVHTAEGAQLTQGADARRFGRRLIVSLFRGDREWIDENVDGQMFWSHRPDTHELTASNFSDVAYASTRMMHAWPQPAWIDGAAYIDGSYLKLIPDDEVRSRINGPLIAVGSEPGPVLRTFGGEVVPEDGNTISITPDFQLSEVGVEFETATPDGMRRAYEHGLAKGQAAAAKLANMRDAT